MPDVTCSSALAAADARCHRRGRRLQIHAGQQRQAGAARQALMVRSDVRTRSVKVMSDIQRADALDRATRSAQLGQCGLRIRTVRRSCWHNFASRSARTSAISRSMGSCGALSSRQKRHTSTTIRRGEREAVLERDAPKGMWGCVLHLERAGSGPAPCLIAVFGGTEIYDTMTSFWSLTYPRHACCSFPSCRSVHRDDS